MQGHFSLHLSSTFFTLPLRPAFAKTLGSFAADFSKTGNKTSGFSCQFFPCFSHFNGIFCHSCAKRTNGPFLKIFSANLLKMWKTLWITWRNADQRLTFSRVFHNSYPHFPKNQAKKLFFKNFNFLRFPLLTTIFAIF